MPVSRVPPLASTTNGAGGRQAPHGLQGAAVETQGAGGRAQVGVAGHLQRAAVQQRAAAVGIGAALGEEGQQPWARLGQGAGTGDNPRQGQGGVERCRCQKCRRKASR